MFAGPGQGTVGRPGQQFIHLLCSDCDDLSDCIVVSAVQHKLSSNHEYHLCGVHVCVTRDRTQGRNRKWSCELCGRGQSHTCTENQNGGIVRESRGACVEWTEDRIPLHNLGPQGHLRGKWDWVCLIRTNE